MNEEKLLTPSETSEFLGKSITTLRRWDANGILPSIRGGELSHRRYKKIDLINFLEKRKKTKLNHSQNTFIFDFDSTLFPQETLDEVLKLALENDPQKAGKAKQIEAICQKGMEGEITLTESLNQRLALARIHKKDIQKYLETAPFIDFEMQKCIDFLQQKDQKIFIISGGFIEWILPLSQILKISKSHIFANQLRFDSEGYVSGFMNENPLCQNGGKSKLIQELQSAGMLQGDIIMIGDGSSDLEVLTQGQADLFLGFGIYQKRKIIQENTSHFFINFTNFYTFLKTLLS